MRKLLLGLIGLLFAVPAVATDLPAGYTELEYIESTGTQYIDTGYKPSNNTKIDITASLASVVNGHIFGSRMTNTGGGGFAVATISNIFAFDYNGDRVYGISPTVGTVYRIVKNGAENQISYGTTVNTYSNSASTFSVDATMALFGINTAGTITSSAASIKIYSAQIEESGVLVRDFVPARRDSDGVIGMYDTVNNVFYTNQGTGEFTAGPEVSIKIATTAYNSARFSPVVTELNSTIATIRSVVTNTINQTKAIADLQATKQTRPDETCPAGKKCLLVEDDAGMPHWYEIIENAYGLPSGYTGLEYVDMQSESYLQTDIVPTYDGRVEMDFQTTTIPAVGGSFMGGRSGSYPSGLTFGFNANKTFIFDGFSTNRYESTNLLTNNTRYKYTWNNQVAKLETGGSVVGTNTFTGTGTTTHPLFINGANNAGSVIGNKTDIYLYSFKVWNAQGELVMDLIPAKNSSGVIGMYDTVSGTFFTNKGSGTFTAGPEVQ